MPDQTHQGSLGEFLRETRIALGLSQAQLASSAKINQGNLSRIESGQNPAPNDDTLRSIAQVLVGAGADAGIYEVLVGLRDRPIPPAPRERGPSPAARDDDLLRIGFAHCIWSAPLVLQEEKSALLGVEMYSRARRENGALQPYRNGMGSRNDGATARELVELVQAGMLDTVLVAQDVVDETPNLLFPCAQILHGVGGSQMVVAYDPDQLDIDEDGGLCAAWQKLVAKFEARQLKVLFPPGTNAESHYRWVDSLEQLRDMVPVEIDLGNWIEDSGHPAASGVGPGSPVQTPVVNAVAELVAKHGACVFIAWEPYVSWLREFGSAGRRPRFKAAVGYVHELGEAAQPLPYISFTLAVKRENVPRLLIDARFNRFLDDLKARCSNLGDPDRIRWSYFTRIATYLGMSDDRARESLRRLPFRMSFSPEWVDGLRELAYRGARPVPRRDTAAQSFTTIGWNPT
jgi:transcriptional regulator with XRE-family HTH domain